MLAQPYAMKSWLDLSLGTIATCTLNVALESYSGYILFEHHQEQTKTAKPVSVSVLY